MHSIVRNIRLGSNPVQGILLQRSARTHHNVRTAARTGATWQARFGQVAKSKNSRRSGRGSTMSGRTDTARHERKQPDKYWQNNTTSQMGHANAIARGARTTTASQHVHRCVSSTLEDPLGFSRWHWHRAHRHEHTPAAQTTSREELTEPRNSETRRQQTMSSSINNSTRMELIAAIIATYAPRPITIAIDNQAVVKGSRGSRTRGTNQRDGSTSQTEICGFGSKQSARGVKP